MRLILKADWSLTRRLISTAPQRQVVPTAVAQSLTSRALTLLMEEK